MSQNNRHTSYEKHSSSMFNILGSHNTKIRLLKQIQMFHLFNIKLISHRMGRGVFEARI